MSEKETDQLKHSAEVWNALAHKDATFVALTNSDFADNESFFDSGRQEIDYMFDLVEKAGLKPNLHGTALDFGCGPGRLTQALAARFHQAIGFDVAPEMVNAAKGFSTHLNNISFRLLDTPKLPDTIGPLSFVYSSRVFQHIPPELVTTHINELSKLLEPRGIFVFQFTDHLKISAQQRIKNTVAITRRNTKAKLKQFLKPNAVSNKTPKMPMFGTPETDIRRVLDENNLTIHAVYLTDTADIDSGPIPVIFEAPRPEGWVSKLLITAKT